MWIRHAQPSERVAAFSAWSIFNQLPDTICRAYDKFVGYFNDEMLHRNAIYAVLLCIGLAMLGYASIQLIKRNRWANVIISAIAILLIPLAANVIGVLIPYNDITMLMSYQMVLLVPLLVSMCERVLPNNRIGKCTNLIIYMAVILVSWSYVISANATLKCYDLSYRHLYAETTQIITDIRAQEGYDGEARICFAGFVDDRELRENIETYQYCVGLTENVAFWNDWNGINNCWHNYVLNNFGYEIGRLEREEYDEIIQSEAFEEMSVWPAKGAIRQFEDVIVVKLSENPPQ